MNFPFNFRSETPKRDDTSKHKNGLVPEHELPKIYEDGIELAIIIAKDWKAMSSHYLDVYNLIALVMSVLVIVFLSSKQQTVTFRVETQNDSTTLTNRSDSRLLIN